MATFPGGVYSVTNPTPTASRASGTTGPAEQVAGLNGEVEAIETWLGAGTGSIPVANLPASIATTIRSTTGAPTVLSTDIVGDFAFDPAACILYGPLTGTPAVGQPWINGGTSGAVINPLLLTTGGTM